MAGVELEHLASIPLFSDDDFAHTVFDRHGDPGRDLALYLGRTTGAKTLSALGKAAADMSWL